MTAAVPAQAHRRPAPSAGLVRGGGLACTTSTFLCHSRVPMLQAGESRDGHLAALAVWWTGCLREACPGVILNIF